MAESGSTRRGAISRRSGDAVTRRPQFADRGQGAPVAHPMDARRPAPAFPPRGRRELFGTGRAQIVEFLCGPVRFALLGQDARDRLAQLDQQLDVQGGVVEPLGGQRALGPVGRPVPLGQSETQEPFDHDRQVHPVEPGQSSGQLGVVELRRPHADLGQARQVLIGGVQDPFVVAEHVRDGPQRGQRVGAVADRVDEHGAGAGPPDLDQIGPVGVAEPRRPLGVHRERPVPAAQQLARPPRSRRPSPKVAEPLRRGAAAAWVRARCRRVRRLPVRACQARDREPRSVTPAGGRPAACSSTSQNASTCTPRSGVVAVHDARSSSWWARGGPEMSP